MRIEGLGFALADQMIEKKIVRDVADLYSLTLESLTSLGTHGGKVCLECSGSDEASKSRDLASDLRAPVFVM